MFETEGTKYHPLFEHLLFSGQGSLAMSFVEIEAIIGASLPPSARVREEWWSNSPSGHSQARAWMRASYRASQVDLAGQKVVFSLEGWPDRYVKATSWPRTGLVRQAGMSEESRSNYVAQATEAPAAEPELSEHPLFGIWRGKLTLLPGYDYTKPAFELDAAS